MWESAVLTNAGRDLLAQWAAGGELTIDKVACGQGTVNEAYLMGQTQLVAQKKLLSIVRRANVAQGVQLQLQCTNGDVSAAFTINQIGVWAHLDNGASVMIAIYQDSTGVLVPAAAEMADYVFTFYATLQMSTTGALTVTIDSSALVSMETFGKMELKVEEVAEDVQNIIDGTLPVAKAANADHATSADHAINADHATSADTATSAGTATNADHATSADTATSAGTATNADHATSADSATNADHATSADTATSAGTATNADHATSADSATNADHATSADTATSAGSAATAETASRATADGDGNNIAATYAKKTKTETHSIQSTEWAALSDVAKPFAFSATFTATNTIGADSIVELFNDQPIIFATYGFVIASISGQTVTVYALEQPTAAVNLTIGVTG